MHKLPSSHAPSCAVNRYIGSDFDAVIAVAEQIGAIKNLEELLFGDKIHILKTVGHSIVGTFSTGGLINGPLDYIVDGLDIYHYVGSTYPYMVNPGSKPNASFVKGYRGSVEDWNAFDAALLKLANIPLDGSPDTVDNSKRLNALFAMGLAIPWASGLQIKSNNTLLIKDKVKYYAPAASPTNIIVTTTDPIIDSNFIKWGVSTEELNSKQSKSFSFESGGTLGVNDKYVPVIYKDPAGNYYEFIWQGILPKVVPPNSTPESTGGIGDTGWGTINSNTVPEDSNNIFISETAPENPKEGAEWLRCSDMKRFVYYINSNGLGQWVESPVSTGIVMPAVPTYVNNAAAISGGLSINAWYKTPTGELRVRV